MAHLALKHRQNKHQRMRIVLFIGSPILTEPHQLEAVGKKLRKSNVAVDIVSFGDTDLNAAKLELFMAAVNKNNNSNLVTVPPGAVIADVLLDTPIFIDEDSLSGGSGFAAAAAAASSQVMHGFGGGETFVTDGSEDPALLLALRVSLEEERARQHAQAHGEISQPCNDPCPLNMNNAATVQELPAPVVTPNDAEDLLLRRAFDLSMGEESSSLSTFVGNDVAADTVDEALNKVREPGSLVLEGNNTARTTSKSTEVKFVSSSHSTCPDEGPGGPTSRDAKDSDPTSDSPGDQDAS